MSNDDEKKNNRDFGQLVFWSGDRGYGFIRSPNAERDVFVHFRDCELPRGEMPSQGTTSRTKSALTVTASRVLCWCG